MDIPGCSMMLNGFCMFLHGDILRESIAVQWRWLLLAFLEHVIG